MVEKMQKSTNERVMIAGAMGVIEAVLESAPQPAFISVVCHPHPLYGGTMENKVVTTLCRAVRDGGGAALRFNFRGVGKSDGTYGEGIGEAEDLLAAMHWLQARFPELPLWLAGFSFGSYVAAYGAVSLRANEQAPSHLFLVAPPVHHFDFAAITNVGCAVTVVQGDDDEVVAAEQVHQWAQQSPLQPELIRFSECGHFFHGRLSELKQLALSRLPDTRA